MQRDHDPEYRRTEAETRAFLKRIGEICSDKPANDDLGDYLGDRLDDECDENPLSESDKALLLELDDDPVETPGDEPVAIETASAANLDEIEAVERLNERSDAIQAAYRADARFPEHLKVTTPEDRAVLARFNEMLKSYMAERERKNAASKAFWSKLFDEASARIHAQERKAKADARAARDVARKRDQRAGQITAKRVSALEDAIANHGGDHRLVKLIGRAGEFAQFREALTAARSQHGPKASLTKIAAIWSMMTGTAMTKFQCRKRLEVVGKLEAKGGPWYRWRAS